MSTYHGICDVCVRERLLPCTLLNIALIDIADCMLNSHDLKTHVEQSIIYHPSTRKWTNLRILTLKRELRYYSNLCLLCRWFGLRVFYNVRATRTVIVECHPLLLV